MSYRMGKYGCDIRYPFDCRVGAPTTSNRIEIISLATKEIANYSALTRSVLLSYAQRHGYSVLFGDYALDDRPASWSKLLLIAKEFDRGACEWACWFDADIVIRGLNKDLRQFCDEEYDFIVGDDAPTGPIQMGVFFARNCPAVRDFFNRVYAKKEFIDHPFWEQAAVWDVMRDGTKGLRLKIVPRRWFNSFASEYQPGDFAIHYAGWNNEDRFKAIKKLVGE